MASRITRTVLSILGGGSLVALLGLTYQIWHDADEKSAMYGENKAALAFASGQLSEIKAENERLKSEKLDLQKQIDNLRQELLTENTNNKYSKRLLDEGDNKTKQLETVVAQLSTSLKNADPCAPLRKDISDLEDQLQRPEYILPRLNATQREQAKVMLDKKYTSLDICQSSRR